MDNTDNFEEHLNNAIDTINEVVNRKIREIESLEVKGNEEKLINYLKLDISSYINVLNDISDTENILEKMEFDEEMADEFEVSGGFQNYLDNLSSYDLKKENEADDLRNEYYEELVDNLSFEIGLDVIQNKKMLKAILKNDLAIMALGDIVMSDEGLYEMYEKNCSKIDKPKKKKKKSK
jgi:hypothetical protein